MKKKGFTLIELLVVIAIIAMLLAILMPALNKVKKIAQRVICGTNLKGLGTAQTVYANDYDDEYVIQGQGYAHNWGSFTDSWQFPTKAWSAIGTMTVGSSLYLLVREADVAPKSFVCPASEQIEFTGKNPNNEDIVNLWDFGNPAWGGVSPREGAVNCVSYSYHMPYAAGQTTTPAPASTGSKGRYAADARRSAAFAVMADKNPYFEPKLIRGGATPANYMDRVTLISMVSGTAFAAPTDFTNLDRKGLMISNAYPHGREGQNVTYADGHNSWETRPDVSIKNDNIYTRWGTLAVDTTGIYNRRGAMPANPLTDMSPQSIDDSVLVNDGPISPAG